MGVPHPPPPMLLHIARRIVPRPSGPARRKPCSLATTTCSGSWSDVENDLAVSSTPGDQRSRGRTVGRINERMDGWNGGRERLKRGHGRMGGRTGGWLNGRTDGWKDEQQTNALRDIGTQAKARSTPRRRAVRVETDLLGWEDAFERRSKVKNSTTNKIFWINFL